MSRPIAKPVADAIRATLALAVDPKKEISFRLLVVCCTKKPLDEHATRKNIDEPNMQI